MGTKKSKIEITVDLLNIFYAPDSLGTELKKNTTFVKFVHERLAKDRTESEIRDELNGIFKTETHAKS